MAMQRTVSTPKTLASRNKTFQNSALSLAVDSASLYNINNFYKLCRLGNKSPHNYRSTLVDMTVKGVSLLVQHAEYD